MNRRQSLIIIFIFTLSNCGGGGGGDNTEELSLATPASASNTSLSSGNACIVSSSGAPAVTQQKNWRHYSSDQFSSRYLDSDKLSASNFSDLTIEWRWVAPSEELMDSDPNLIANRNASTPIMINGVLYTTSQFNHVNAINAETGEEIWEFNPLSYLQGSAVNHGWIHRGLAYWEKDEDKLVSDA